MIMTLYLVSKVSAKSSIGPPLTKIFYHEQFSHENIQQWIFPKLQYSFNTSYRLYIKQVIKSRVQNRRGRRVCNYWYMHHFSCQRSQCWFINTSIEIIWLDFVAMYFIINIKSIMNITSPKYYQTERTGASWKSYSHNRISVKNKNLFGWLDFSPSFGKDFVDEVITEQLTPVVGVRVGVIFMHMMICRYPNS